MIPQKFNLLYYILNDLFRYTCHHTIHPHNWFHLLYKINKKELICFFMKYPIFI